MNEERTINEQDLDKVTGGTGGGDNGFEAAWAEYAKTHCGYNCGVMGIREMMCEYGKMRAAEEWTPGGPVKCPAFFGVC